MNELPTAGLFRPVALSGLLVLLTSCISPEQHRQTQLAMQAKDEQIADLIRTNKEYQRQNQALSAEVQRLGGIAMDSEAVKAREAELTRLIAQFKASEASVGKAGGDGISFHNTADGTAIRVEGRVLFASGSHELSQAGMNSLQSVLDIVRNHAGKIRVAGHTDTDKISRSAGRYKDNLDLSCERAQTVLRYLAKAGIEPARMSASGYGEYHPVDPSDKAKNRRVEIVLLRAAPAASK